MKSGPFTRQLSVHTRISRTVQLPRELPGLCKILEKLNRHSIFECPALLPCNGAHSSVVNMFVTVAEATHAICRKHRGKVNW
jgi:hypothetical protein